MALRVLSGPAWLVRRSTCAWRAARTGPPGADESFDLVAVAGSFPRRAIALPAMLPEETLLVGGPPTAEADAILARCGGVYAPGARRSLFRRVVAPYVLPPALAVAGHPATMARYADRVAGTEDGLTALLAAAAADGLRIVHHPALDACEDRRRRVLLVVTSLHRGGAERLVLDLVESRDLSGIVPLLARTHEPIRGAYPEPPGTIHLPRHAPAAPLPYLGIDALYLHLIDGTVARSLAAFGIPIATCVHNAPDGWPPGLVEPRGPGRGGPPSPASPLPGKLRVDADGRASLASPLPGNSLAVANGSPIDLYLGCGEAVARALRGVVGAPWVRPLTNGIVPAPAVPRRLAASAAGNRRTLRVLVVANIRPQKRLDRLPAILDAVHRRDPHVLCTISLAGEAVSRNAASLAAEEALQAALANAEYAATSGNFVRLGPREDVPELLADADVLLLPSAWEGVPLVVLEALAAGVPVVATAVGGLPEVASRHPGRVTLVPVEERDEAEIVGGLAAALLDGCRPPSTGPTSTGLHPVHTARSYARRTAQALRVLIDRPPGAGERILLITNHFHVGGAQTSARRLLTGMARRGIPVAAIVLEEQASFPTVGTAALRAANLGIQVYVASNARTHPIVDVAEEARAFAAAFGATTVFFWNALFEVKALFAEAFSGARIFDVSPGEMYFASMFRYFQRPNAESSVDTPERYGALLDGVVVKYSQETDAARRLGAPVTVIPNGVLPGDDPSLPPLPRPARPIAVVGTLARLSPDKKLEELIEAFRLLPPELGLTLRIAGGEDGDADYAERLRASAADVPAIAFVGHREALSFLHEIDLFVAISEPAGCPNATLEALVFGLPVLATDHGAAREQVSAEDLVPRGDAQKLADAIRARCTDWEEAWRRVNRHVGVDRQRFSVDRFVDEYLALSRSFSTF